MDIFDFRRSVIGDYAAYTRSFITVREPTLRRFVDEQLDAGVLWPEPLIQLNPAFEAGESVDDLVAAGVLHPECRHVFRVKTEADPAGRRLNLHRHQAEAIRVARTGFPYVLTTGTGSGKSLAYIIPVVDHVLRHGSGKGIRAVVVYPMNALANSQLGELRKFLSLGYADGRGPVTFARYTGQEGPGEREAILADPPDILLTNYVMLELILTRPRDRQLVRAARGLQFLVFDELHTYRGRQGADVAMLIRRVRDATAAPRLQCVGTSATLSTAGTLVEQRRQVAAVAGQLFGTEVRPEHVIGETLRRVTVPGRTSSASRWNLAANSACHCSAICGGHRTANRRTSPRSTSSRVISPASTLFAQHTTKVDEVVRELEAAREAVGTGVDVAGFVRTALTATGATVAGTDTARIDLTEVPRALKDQVVPALGLKPGKETFAARFELPVTGAEILLTRTAPAVEALANHVLNAALDPHLDGPARRCGVIRTSKVSRRTTLLLLRHRFHIVTRTGDAERPLLAEDSQLVAFAGSPQNAEWLPPDAAEQLLAAEPEANVTPEQSRDFVQKVVDGVEALRPKLAEFARDRGEALLQAHTRVRQESRARGVRHRVEAQDLPDVLGVFVYLPKV